MDMGLQSDVKLEEMWVILFPNAIGNLMYVVVCIRPNIAKVVEVVNQFMILDKHIRL
jgi:hypothetical protein